MSNRRKRHRIRPEAKRALAVLGVLAVMLYLLLGTALGSFLAERVVAPIFAWADERTSATAEITPDIVIGDDTDLSDSVSAEPEQLSVSETPGEEPLSLMPTDSPLSTTNTDTNDLDSSSEEVVLDETLDYALQIGAFSSQENAEQAAQEWKERGAAGYVYQDGLYRVFALVYQTQEDAKRVKDQLMTDNVESSVFKITTPAVAMRVTASQQGLQTVNQALGALSSAKEELYTICMALDKKEMDETAARSKLQELADQANAPLEALQSAGTGDVGTALSSELQRTAQTIGDLAKSTKSGTDFSTEVKYALVRQVCAYAELMKGISQNMA